MKLFGFQTPEKNKSVNFFYDKNENKQLVQIPSDFEAWINSLLTIGSNFILCACLFSKAAGFIGI